MAIERQVVLECVQPNKGHNKYYEITIREANQNRHEVYARWGRIEHFKDGNPQTQIKFSTDDWDEAMSRVGTIVHDKAMKGYKLVKDNATNPHKKVEFTSKSQQKRVAAQKDQPIFDRTEHVEVIVSDWWKGSDNIEERSV